MKHIKYFLIFFISLNVTGQIDVKTYHEVNENGYFYYADNNEFCPVSIKITFNLKNLKSSEGNNKIFILPANTKKIKITTLTPIKKGKYGFSSKTRYNFGDHFLEEYKKNYDYCLPYQKGESYILSQGYNGHVSHQNKNQLDFTMPVGTKIVAARDGIVIDVVDKNNKHCGTQECEKYNNYIYVYHKDGTIAEYLHIKMKGSKVRKGDVVKEGQVIAESGNVGWSTGPHLHFSVYIQRIDKRNYIKTKFKIKEGNSLEYLVEKKEYKRNY